MSALAFGDVVAAVVASEKGFGGFEAPPKTLPWLPPIVDFQDFSVARQKPMDFVIADLLIAGRAHLLTGVGGSSKSTLLAQFGVGVASGEQTLGWDIRRPGSVVLLLAEDTADDARRLISMIIEALDLDENKKVLIRNRLHVFAAAGVDCKLVKHPEAGGDTGRRLQEFTAYCKTLPDIALIGLDPAIALTRGRELDEIDQRDLANAVERLAIETGAAVVLVSHAAKHVQYAQELGSHLSRGSGALTDALRLEMLMRTMTAREAKSFGVPELNRHRYVRFQITKANRLPPEAMHPVWLQRGEGGVLLPANLQVVTRGGATVKRLDQQALALFLEIDDSTGEMLSKSMKQVEWRRACESAGLLTGESAGSREMAARRWMLALESGGFVVKDNDRWQLTEAGMELAHGDGEVSDVDF